MAKSVRITLMYQGLQPYSPTLPLNILVYIMYKNMHLRLSIIATFNALCCWLAWLIWCNNKCCKYYLWTVAMNALNTLHSWLLLKDNNIWLRTKMLNFVQTVAHCVIDSHIPLLSWMWASLMSFDLYCS